MGKMLHMIGNAHIDPVWLWNWQEGFQEVKATFRSALDRLNESNDFVFTSSSAAYYEWVEKNAPDMFEEIQQRVREGRWVIVGGWWIQPDCNIPNGESFVRQGLYGQRYFQQKFGVQAKVGYNVDSFGHFGMLPQILRKSGMPYYVFMRPGPHENNSLSHVFWWESDDGSRVLTYRIPYRYNSGPDEIRDQVIRCAELLSDEFPNLMCFYGVGNHGGGPTRRNIQNIYAMREENKRDSSPNGLPADVAIEFSTPNHFFETIEEKSLAFPTVHDDLQHHASGCYAAHSGVKQWNRRAENALNVSEKLSSIALWATGQAYPSDFDQAWKSVLFNQFHDILAGTSLEGAYTDARDSYGEALSIASRGLNYGIQALSWNVDIPYEEDTTPIFVFHPHAWQSNEPIQLEFGRWVDGSELVDEEGNAIPVQSIRSHVTVNGRARICFAADLPSMGYRTFRLRRPGSDTPPTGSSRVAALPASDTHIENEYLRLDIDPSTGIMKLYDKIRNIQVSESVSRAVVIDDRSDTWSHGVFRFNDEVDSFKVTRVRVIENGPVVTTLRVSMSYEGSSLTQDFCVYRGIPRVDVRVTVDWHGKFQMLKLRFPVNVTQAKATYEIPYGHIVRPTNGEEEPGQNWVDLSGVTESGVHYGLTVVNDGKYSFDVKESEIGLTVLRSPIYAHHDPVVPNLENEYTFMDQGIQQFSYSLVPHAGDLVVSEAVRVGQELNQPPVALVETYHDGALPRKQSFIEIDQPNIIVGALKKAEDSDQDLVLRCYETNKVDTKATISLPQWGRTFTTTFGPCEIKTFYIPKDPQKSVSETDLLEQGNA